MSGGIIRQPLAEGNPPRKNAPAENDFALALFRDTIRQVNSRDYSPEQIRAWASDDIDPVAWACTSSSWPAGPLSVGEGRRGP